MNISDFSIGQAVFAIVEGIPKRTYIESVHRKTVKVIVGGKEWFIEPHNICPLTQNQIIAWEEEKLQQEEACRKIWEDFSIKLRKERVEENSKKVEYLLTKRDVPIPDFQKPPVQMGGSNQFLQPNLNSCWYDRNNPYNILATSLFFGKTDTTFSLRLRRGLLGKEENALNCVYDLLTSMQCKYEDKIASAAYLLYQWFDI